MPNCSNLQRRRSISAVFEITISQIQLNCLTVIIHYLLLRVQIFCYKSANPDIYRDYGYNSSEATKCTVQRGRHLNEGDYNTALPLLTSAKEILSEDTTVVVTYDTVAADYKESLLADAEAAYEADGYRAAVDVLNNRHSTLQDDEVLDQIEYYKGLAPVKLSSLTAYEKGAAPFAHTFSATDCLGVEYTDIIYKGSDMFTAGYANAWETYRISEKYSSMSGTVFIDSKSTYNSANLYVYGDGLELYAVTVKGGTDLIEFSINLTGVKVLKIKLFGDIKGARVELNT